jgi:hypothetical protein
MYDHGMVEFVVSPPHHGCYRKEKDDEGYAFAPVQSLIDKGRMEAFAGIKQYFDKQDACCHVDKKQHPRCADESDNMNGIVRKPATKQQAREVNQKFNDKKGREKPAEPLAVFRYFPNFPKNEHIEGEVDEKGVEENFHKTKVVKAESKKQIYLKFLPKRILPCAKITKVLLISPRNIDN